MSVNVLRGVQVVQVFPNIRFSSVFVCTDSVSQGGAAQGLPGGITLRAKDHDSQNRKHDEQRDGQPERKEDFQEQAFHGVPVLVSRGRAKM